MNRLALRGTRSIVRYSPYLLRRSRVGMALNAARFAYNNRRGIKRGYRLIRKVVAARRRKKQKFSTKNFGKPPGEGTAKKFTTRDEGPLNLATRELYSFNLVGIPRSTTNEIDLRERQVANIRGVRICLALRNNLNTVIFFNVAVIVPKDKYNTSTPIEDEDFFRGTGQERSIPFSTGLNSLDFHCRPINTDKYTILFHKRYRIGESRDAETSPDFTTNGTNYMNFDRWVKINRQLQWPDRNSTFPVQAPFLVYWADRMLNGDGALSEANAFTLMERFVCYYREPKNC